MQKLLIMVAILSAQNAFAIDTNQKSDAVIAKLEVLDSLGLQCQSQLEVNGMDGVKSSECSKYLKNIKGSFFQSIQSDCGLLMQWYEEKQKFIRQNGNELAEKNPEIARKLLASMRKVDSACSIESLQGYTYIAKPLDTMNALSELN